MFYVKEGRDVELSQEPDWDRRVNPSETAS
jgi:hypothetical protein